MAKPDILLTRAIYAPAVAALERAYTVHKLWQDADPAQLLREVGPRIRALVTPGITGFTRDQLDALPALRRRVTVDVDPMTVL